MRTTERITVTLPSELAQQVRARVDAGRADSISAYVTQAVEHVMAREEALARWDTLIGYNAHDPKWQDAMAWARQLWGVDEEDHGSDEGRQAGAA